MGGHTKQLRSGHVYWKCLYSARKLVFWSRSYKKRAGLTGEILEYFSIRGNVIVCGDFNAQTGTLADYIFMDNVNNQYPLPLSYSRDQINSRCSMDKSVQKNGRRLTNICIDNSVCILNGRSLGDQRGSYTCMSSQGSSLVDYFLCFYDIVKEVGMMAAQPFTQLSDPCPLLLKIHLPIALPARSKKPSLTTSRPARHTNSQQHGNQTHTRFCSTGTMTQQKKTQQQQQNTKTTKKKQKKTQTNKQKTEKESVQTEIHR